MKGSYSHGRGSRGKTGYRGTGTGASTNSCARHPRSARAKAVKGRTKSGAHSSRPMEWTYREIPFGTPRANLKGI